MRPMNNLSAQPSPQNQKATRGAHVHRCGTIATGRGNLCRHPGPGRVGGGDRRAVPGVRRRGGVAGALQDCAIPRRSKEHDLRRYRPESIATLRRSRRVARHARAFRALSSIRASRSPHRRRGGAGGGGSSPLALPCGMAARRRMSSDYIVAPLAPNSTVGGGLNIGRPRHGDGYGDRELEGLAARARTCCAPSRRACGWTVP